MRMKSGPIALTASAFALVATPVTAAELPLPRPAAVVELDQAAAHSRRYRHRDDGIDAGDVFAGVLVLGAVAALAGAFDGDRDRPRRYPDDIRHRERDREDGGIGRAVDMCLAAIERARGRVERIEQATRDARGWHVSGIGADGACFSCRIGSDGRIETLDLGGSYETHAPPAGYGQHADAVYARLREERRVSPAGPDEAAPGYDFGNEEPLPAYPGGPLPGEEGYESFGDAPGG